MTTRSASLTLSKRHIARNPPRKKAPTLVRTAPPKNIEERIRLRAYELFEARGREHGRDLDDWLQAEAEIIGSEKMVTDAQRKAAAA